MADHAQFEAQLQRVHEASEGLGEYSDALLSDLRNWRLARMEHTYRDLAGQKRYCSAVQFLLHDLFGTQELAERGRELNKARSAMVRMLPDTVLDTVARAVEFTGLTLELDLAMIRCLSDDSAGGRISEADFRRALCNAARRSELERQIALVVEVGQEIERLVHKPFISAALKMCRRPARSMGLSALQDFLERGFHAFKQMKGSEQFLETFRQRELEFLEAIFEEKE